MSDYKSVNVSGIFVPLLTTLFIGLKLTGNIDWSWWWVLSPIWISIGITIVVLIIAAIVAWIVILAGK